MSKYRLLAVQADKLIYNPSTTSYVAKFKVEKPFIFQQMQYVEGGTITAQMLYPATHPDPHQVPFDSSLVKQFLENNFIVNSVLPPENVQLLTNAYNKGAYSYKIPLAQFSGNTNVQPSHVYFIVFEILD